VTNGPSTDPNYSVARMPDGTWAIFRGDELVLRAAEGECVDLATALDARDLLRAAGRQPA
jgi:hypothetical protein